MANPDQVARLLGDVTDWNEWRRRNPDARVDLVDADLCGATLGGADLHGADLTGANLHWADMQQTVADVHRAQANRIAEILASIRGRVVAAGNESSVAESACGRTNLNGACLYGIDLVWSNLSGVDFTEADLTQANLAGALLCGALLTGANLAGANLADVDFAGAEIEGVTGFTPDQRLMTRNLPDPI